MRTEQSECNRYIHGHSPSPHVTARHQPSVRGGVKILWVPLGVTLQLFRQLYPYRTVRSWCSVYSVLIVTFYIIDHVLKVFTRCDPPHIRIIDHKWIDSHQPDVSLVVWWFDIVLMNQSQMLLHQNFTDKKIYCAYYPRVRGSCTGIHHSSVLHAQKRLV